MTRFRAIACVTGTVLPARDGERVTIQVRRGAKWAERDLDRRARRRLPRRRHPAGRLPREVPRRVRRAGPRALSVAPANVNGGWVGVVRVPHNVTRRSTDPLPINVVGPMHPQSHFHPVGVPPCDVRGHTHPPYPAAVQDARATRKPARAAPPAPRPTAPGSHRGRQRPAAPSPSRPAPRRRSTPSCSAVSVSSHVSGSGSSTPRSVITFTGPRPGSPSRSRSPRPAP